MNSGYLTTKDLRERYRCSSRTVFRWMQRRFDPLPPPSMRHAGSFNLWDRDEVQAWEARQRSRCSSGTLSITSGHYSA